ncbi:ribonuclease HII [Bifidobacterium longum]|uniref:ribonuclease HII n=1 Tax=Bifidobacterium longum TaxID=216816 RepID=UPI002024A7CB|nr:ribonuclease HII [Bifidobacterium longum]
MITPTLDLERSLAAQGYDLITGFDEVGRGALAGPVMVGCAAIWARDLEPLDGDDAVELSGRTYLGVPDGVADSKMLTEHRREAIFDELRDWCTAYAVGQASNTEIDEWGITYALGVAALRALSQVERELGLRLGGGLAARKASMESAGEIVEGRPGDSVGESIGNCGESVRALPKVAGILDGPSDYITKALNTFDAPDVPIPADITTKVKGDQHCATVATAAVIAKVTRDRLMVGLAQSNPRYAAYEWAHNKGYGSAAHRTAIAEHGPTPLHRVSWHLT